MHSGLSHLHVAAPPYLLVFEFGGLTSPPVPGSTVPSHCAHQHRMFPSPMHWVREVPPAQGPGVLFHGQEWGSPSSARCSKAACRLDYGCNHHASMEPSEDKTCWRAEDWSCRKDLGPGDTVELQDPL